jgi:hypothetical protein
LRIKKEWIQTEKGVERGGISGGSKTGGEKVKIIKKSNQFAP